MCVRYLLPCIVSGFPGGKKSEILQTHKSNKTKKEKKKGGKKKHVFFLLESASERVIEFRSRDTTGAGLVCATIPITLVAI